MIITRQGGCLRHRAKLKRARWRKGLSLIALAAQMGITKTTLSNWEMGHTEPTSSQLQQWCDHLGLVCKIKLSISIEPPKSPDTWTRDTGGRFTSTVDAGTGSEAGDPPTS